MLNDEPSFQDPDTDPLDPQHLGFLDPDQQKYTDSRDKKSTKTKSVALKTQIKIVK